MKATFENFLLIKYCLNRPISLTVVLVALFATIISVDQSMNECKSGIEKNNAFKIANLNSSYVAWSSTNPEIISRFKDAKIESNSSHDPGYFMSFKTTAQNLINYAELQLRLIKRVVGPML